MLLLILSASLLHCSTGATDEDFNNLLQKVQEFQANMAVVKRHAKTLLFVSFLDCRNPLKKLCELFYMHLFQAEKDDIKKDLQGIKQLLRSLAGSPHEEKSMLSKAALELSKSCVVCILKAHVLSVLWPRGMFLKSTRFSCLLALKNLGHLKPVLTFGPWCGSEQGMPLKLAVDI